jgi:hypothetical protein
VRPRRVGELTFGIGLAVGFATILIGVPLQGRVSTVHARLMLHDIGVSAWAVGILVGLPVWLTGWALERRHGRGRKPST